MKVELRPGLQGRDEAIVDTTNVAVVMGSGDLDVFATPAMIALMEQAACNAIAETLEEGISTVGAQISVEHLSATPVGMRVWAEATLTAHEGRSYDFTIEAFDEAGLIGRATHKRVAVKSARFLEKAEAKKNA